MATTRKARRQRTAPARTAGKRRRRTPEQLLDLLLQAAGDEFERRGYAGATTAAIARRAGVTEAQLFRYFPSKAELFRTAIFKPLNQHFVDFNARHLASVGDASSVREKTRRYIEELQAFIAAHSRMLLSLVVAQTYTPGDTRGVADIDSLEAYFGRGAALMARRVGTDTPVDPRLMVRVSFVAVLACVMFRDWIFPRGLASDADITAAVQSFVIDGINANLQPGDQ